MKMYQSLLDRLIGIESMKDVNEDMFCVIQNVFRLFIEAPPKEIVLGEYILDRMLEVYILQKELLSSDLSSYS